MDVLRGFELEQFRAHALHTTRRPAVVATATGSPLFERVDDANSRIIDSFEDNRRNLRRSAATQGSDVFAAFPRRYTPFDQFQAQNIPYKIDVESERFKLYQWLDFFYRTHYLIPILVDIFTRFPLVGIEFHSQDKQLNEFYEDLFMERLDYEHFLVDLGREYWTLGESFPLGHFNETLGVWEDEELIDPTMVKIRNYPIIGGRQFFFAADGMDDLRTIIEKREPKEIAYLLERDYPEWIPFLKNKKDIPVSDVLLKQVAFKASSRDLHGTPILLRALRTLLHEEKLLASQDAIAERLYSPLILAKLGILDMGQQRGPWIATPNDTRQLRDDLDIVLSQDFRLLVHHIGIDVQNVFGREQMPRLDQDFDRIERRLMQTFGVNPSLLGGGSATQPYASSALQAEFLNQILHTYQGYLIRHYKERALIVAEAQEHYAYERRGDSRIPIKEEVLTYDEDGNEVIIEKNKLMIPDMRMKVLDLRDEATQRQFLQALKQQGVPIPDQDIAMGMHYNFEEALARTEEETIQKTVAQQEAKVKTYDILTAKGLPVPADLKAEIEGMAGFAPPAPGESTQLGINPPNVGDEIVMPPPPDGGPDLGDGATPPIDPNNPTRGQRPEVSDERSPIRPPGQMPTIPGVPGQPGMLGIPGAPKPAVGPVSHTETGKLPRKRNKKSSVPKLTEGLEAGNLEENEEA
jgi:hypothetical protein